VLGEAFLTLRSEAPGWTTARQPLVAQKHHVAGREPQAEQGSAPNPAKRQMGRQKTLMKFRVHAPTRSSRTKPTSPLRHRGRGETQNWQLSPRSDTAPKLAGRYTPDCRRYRAFEIGSRSQKKRFQILPHTLRWVRTLQERGQNRQCLSGMNSS